MTLGTWLFTRLRGELVGTDAAGNRYYRARRRTPAKRERRWVMYRGAPEASQVPTEWHGWLHHATDEAPAAGGASGYPWQKAHQPNQTGTPGAYRPPGHVLKGGRRDRATGDYEPWRPA
jgi:NADH:ubiquinone oxidoreductase subunit